MPEALIRVPRMEELVDMLKKETLPVTIVVTADGVYYKLNENEGYYNTVTKNLGKWGKPVVFGLFGGLGLIIDHPFAKKLGAITLGSAIGEAIIRGFIKPQYVIVEKSASNVLKFKLEGFDPNETFHIYLNGTEVANGTTDANGAAEVEVTGTIEVKATELAVVCGSTTFSNRIPYYITPSA